MVGEHFGHSIDIGKELEKEEELFKKQEEIKKQEQAPKEPSAEELLESTEQESSEEPAEQETEQVPNAEPAQPDTSEEDVNEIIIKDIPVLPPKKTVWDRMFTYHIPFFLLLIVILGFWSLTRAVDLPIIDQRAEQAVEKQLQAGIAQRIAKEWEFLSPKEKALKAARLYAEMRKTPDVDKTIKTLASKLKAQYELPDGLPYFFGIEPYHHYRPTRDVVEGNENAQDLLRLAPLGMPAESSLASFQAIAYSILHAMTGWSLERALFFLPVIVGLGSLVLFFFTVRLITGQSFPALLASIVLVLHPSFVASASAGHPDARAISLFLSLLCIFLFTGACNARGKKRIILLLSIVPAGWAFARLWTIPEFVLGAKELTVSGFLEQFGVFLFILALAGLGVLLHRIAKKKARFLEGFLIVWAGATMAVAFVKPHALLYALPALLAMIAIAADVIARYFQGILDWFMEHPAALAGRIVAGVLVSMIIVGSMWAVVRAEKNVLPQMHDGIMDTAGFIATHSKPDAIITTGWDLGYLWEAAAQRPVALDSGLVSSPRAELLAKAFVTSDEKLARNIIRSLDCNEPVSNESSCAPPEAFVIASQEMLLQLPLIDAIAQRDAGFMPEPNPDIVSDAYPCGGRGQVLRCSEYLVDLTSLDAVSNGKHPAMLYVYRPTAKAMRTFEDATIPYALVLMQGKDGFSSFLVDKDFAESMLVRWFARDSGLKYFEPVFMVDQPERIVTFSVAWNGRNITLQNIVPANTSTSQLSSLLAQSLKD